MNEEPKFALTWTQRAGCAKPEPGLKFEIFDKAKETTITYGAVFRVCATPRCPCLSVCAHCTQLSPDGAASPVPLRWFWLDVGKRVVEMTPQLQADPETLRLAELVSTRLGHTAWEDLHRWFWTAKIQAIETAEVSEIDIVGLPNADDGHLIPFIEVFPLGLSLNFTFENAAWAADEAYCVQPDCRCTEMVLSFFLLREAAGRRATSLRDVPAIRYNYRSQAIRELAPGLAGTPPTRQLLGALKTAYPSLDTRLELHHRIMQLLYVRHDAAQAKLEHERLRAQLPSGASRTGRNDPCPCGSGKKFKKCCGA